MNCGKKALKKNIVLGFVSETKNPRENELKADNLYFIFSEDIARLR